MPPHHSQYILKVTAGPTYASSTNTTIPVNTETPIHISSPHLDASLTVRIKDYRGLPSSSPSTSPYFSDSAHTYDRYSISFSFTPKEDIGGDDLVFGNDFDHPIRDRLPPLFDKAFGIVKWWIDPGLEGDVLADEPYLYGPLLSSINVLSIPSASPSEAEKKQDAFPIFTESTSAEESVAIPQTSSARQKFFLTPSNREQFVFKKDQEYHCDFFNPYLDFNEFALKLGYGMPAIGILGNWDGQDLRPHSLRYVLKNRSSGQELLVFVFTLIPVKDVEGQDKNDAAAAVTEGQKEVEDLD
ncbi:unnamed protein product [Periconia digitata]|uniref:Domain of unknown function at the cortex 1 domain-containing protein n=1 Tax=Periconia digitata TaxID=1303443 RepID=A0A9W4XWK8_9PLEO|nr:unnamed protein product [Periconia digitata]